MIEMDVGISRTFKKDKEPWRSNPEHQAPYQGQPSFVSEYGGILGRKVIKRDMEKNRKPRRSSSNAIEN